MKKPKSLTDEEHIRVFADPDILTHAVQKAVNQAVVAHKRAGRKVCAWKEGSYGMTLVKFQNSLYG